MVAHVRDTVTVDRVLDVQPDFLVEHEEDQVVEEGSHVGLAEAVIAPARD